MFLNRHAPRAAIPQLLGEVPFALHTLPVPIGQTASLTTLIGCLCLAPYKTAEPHTLCLSAGGLVAERESEAPQDSRETGWNAPCTALLNPQSDGF